MARRIYHVRHNPIHHVKKEIKKHRNSHEDLIHTLIENNKQLQENMSHVLKGLNELVSVLKSAGDEPTEENFSMQAETPTTAGSGGDRLTLVEQKVNQLIEQNRQIIEHLKRNRRPGVVWY